MHDRPLAPDRHGERGAAADEQPDQPPSHAQRHGLDQELTQYVAPPGADRMPKPIFLVRSVTDTSMIFIIPMPPRTGAHAYLAR